MYYILNLEIIAKQKKLSQHFHILPVPEKQAVPNYPTGRGNSGHPSEAKFMLQLKILVNEKIDL